MRRFALVLLLVAPAAFAQVASTTLHVEVPSSAARGELVVGQTVAGAIDGLAMCLAVPCQDGRAAAMLSLVGGGAGLAEGILLFPDGLTDGQAAAINAGSFWGLYDGTSFALAGGLLDAEDPDARGLGDGALVGSLGGTVIGITAAAFLRPTAGQVSLFDAGALWSAVLTNLALATTGDYRPEDLAIQAGAATVGGVVTALLTQKLEISRGRVLLIDGGGLVGGLLGSAAAYLVSANPSGKGYAVSTSVGIVGGLALTTFLTRNFDLPKLPDLTLAPVGPKGSLGASVGLHF